MRALLPPSFIRSTVGSTRETFHLVGSVEKILQGFTMELQSVRDAR